MAETRISLSIEADISFTPEQVWPDGDAPDVITAEVVAARMRHGQNLSDMIEDWCLGSSIATVVTVDAEPTPNPAHTQRDALFPDLAPPALLDEGGTTTAVVFR